MIFEFVKIVRDVNLAPSRSVPAWEIPVMEVVFDGGNVQPQGEYERVDRPYPEASYEFNRLAKRYGSDPKTEVPYVMIAYGTAQIGVRALAAAIAEAKALEDKAIADGTAPTVKFAPIPEHIAQRDTLLA